MNKKLKKYSIFAVVLIALIGGVCLLFFRGSKESEVKLDTVRVAKDSISTAITATGTLEAIKSVEVGTQVSGIISKIYVDYNSVVKKGQILAELDKKLLQSALENANATLQTKQVTFENQKRNYERQKMLWQKQAISKVDWETAQTDYETAKLAVTASKAAVVTAQTNLGYATIYSTIDGVVISRAVEEGQTVAASYSTPTLFTIANDLTKMRVIANVDEADIGGVKDGQRVTFTVDAYPDDIFEGKVSQVRLEATTTSNVVTYQVVIEAPNPDLKLKPGMTASANIYTLEESGVTTVPAKAFRFTPDASQMKKMKDMKMDPVIQADSKNLKQKVVWVKSGNRITPRLVTIGVSDGIKTEIKEGISVGDEVIVGVTEVLPQEKANKGSSEASPFMPKRPGENKNKK
ncbi:MAG: efflux RND transporter periplasmic adaptor subunit [Dysgonamonadaceae bacterium]